MQHHQLVIQRSETAFDGPTLLSAVGAEIMDFNSTATHLSFNVKLRVHTTIKIHSPQKPAVTIGDKDVAIEWDAENNLAWVDARLEAGDVTKINL